MDHRARILVDIGMAVLMPVLMAYSLVGETLHEVAGTAIFALFIIHHIQNRKWFGSLTKGKYTADRIFRTVLDGMLLIFMVAQPLSGILMSKHLYTFLPEFPVTASARSVHLLLAYWGYVLLSVHAGTHLIAPFQKLHRNSRKKWAAVVTILGLLSLYGCGAFVKRGFPGYMSGRTAFAFFDFAEPRVFFFLDYLTIMLLFMMAGCLIVFALGNNKQLFF